MNYENQSKPQLVETIKALQQQLADLEAQIVEQKLAEAEHRLSIEIMKQMPDAIVITDANKIIQGWMGMASEVFGYSAAEIVGQHIDTLSHPDCLQEIARGMGQQLQERGYFFGEVPCVHKDGTEIPIEVRAKTILDDTGQPQGYISINRDITERKQAEIALRMEAVGQMAGGIAHNFNNVLTALIGHTELALDNIPPDHSVRPDLESIRKSALRAADLTQQLLTFTRRQNIQPRVINLNDLVSNFSSIIRQILGAEIELVLILEPDLARTRADADQIEQVLINLVVNARDAMPTGGKLIVQTDNAVVKGNQAQLKAGNYTLLCVTDTGVGMTKEVMTQIFEPFYTTKEGNQQVGLGLSMCFGIVKQNQGHILVESKPGQGTTFKVYLPCHVDEKSNAIRSPRKNRSLPTGTETILLVDDARLVREMSARVLRQQGYDVIEAEDGNEALKVIEEYKSLALDLLITDMVMPQMGGEVLAQRVQERFPAVKVLFISGYEYRKTASLGDATLQSAILTKPFSPDMLSIEVRKLLDKDPNPL